MNSFRGCFSTPVGPFRDRSPKPSNHVAIHKQIANKSTQVALRDDKKRKQQERKENKKKRNKEKKHKGKKKAKREKREGNHEKKKSCQQDSASSDTPMQPARDSDPHGKHPKEPDEPTAFLCVQECPGLPGWKVELRKRTSGIAAGQIWKVFIAPNGKRFPSLASAKKSLS